MSRNRCPSPTLARAAAFIGHSHSCHPTRRAITAAAPQHTAKRRASSLRSDNVANMPLAPSTIVNVPLKRAGANVSKGCTSHATFSSKPNRLGTASTMAATASPRVTRGFVVNSIGFQPSARIRDGFSMNSVSLARCSRSVAWVAVGSVQVSPSRSQRRTIGAWNVCRSVSIVDALSLTTNQSRGLPRKKPSASTCSRKDRSGAQ